ncbi:hypothetical protein [Citrobacter amalonaticus]|uniref:hypothetical protein n=1 Tax=Citrobacter amalonaticus TaxID=35703 RepID=UPI00076B1D8E|nr:hypothetical protein [Citrobacter amalonaticus]AMG94294.1 hypothetical protein AL479_18230 [Citrobacter amalonaticus]HED1256463.1 hypothetical protein [Citrobacter amalonaticus]
MSYSDIVATIAMIVSIIAVPASGYFSYKYAINGEKRKEFNAISDVLRIKLYNQIRLIEKGIFPDRGSDSISVNEFDSLMGVTKRKKIPSLDKAIIQYRRSLMGFERLNDYGDLRITDPDGMIKAIKILLPYVDRQ